MSSKSARRFQPAPSAPSDATSYTSGSDVGLARVNETIRGYHQPASCLSWLVPLLMAVGLGLLVYLIYNYSCKGSANNDNNGSANNDNNGVLVISNMTNNNSNNSGGQVVDLDGEKVEAISNQKPIVVVFLAQGCGWCSKVKPNVVEAAKSSPKPLHTLYAHSKNGMDRCKQYNVKGFPTILHIHKGRVLSEYQGDRSTADLLRWIKSLQ